MTVTDPIPTPPLPPAHPYPTPLYRNRRDCIAMDPGTQHNQQSQWGCLLSESLHLAFSQGFCDWTNRAARRQGRSNETPIATSANARHDRSKSETEDKKPLSFRILLLTGQPAGRPRVETDRQAEGQKSGESDRQTDRRNRRTKKWRKRQTDGQAC